MAGAQLAAYQQEIGAPWAGVTVPGDESWLVYTCIIANSSVPGTSMRLAMKSAHFGNEVTLAVGVPEAQPNGRLAAPGVVANAGDVFRVYTGGAHVDFYASGLIQRGPGIVPT